MERGARPRGRLCGGDDEATRFAETEKAKRGFGNRDWGGEASAASPTRRCEENDEGAERGGRKRVD